MRAIPAKMPGYPDLVTNSNRISAPAPLGHALQMRPLHVPEFIRAVRRDVFIVEQNVPEEIDIDGSDAACGCRHLA